MIAAFSPFLALRYLWRRPIMLLGILGVTFAVWALLVVDGVFTGFVTGIRTDVRRSTADVLVTDLPHDTGYGPLRDVIEVDPAVRLTAPRLRHHGLLRARRDTAHGVQTSSVNFEDMTMDSGFALLVGIDPLREVEVTGMRDWLQRAPDSIRHTYEYDPMTVPVLDNPDPESRSYLRVPDHIEWLARGRAGLPRPPDSKRHQSQWPGCLVGFRRLPSMPVLPGDPIDLITARYEVGPDGRSEVLTRRIPLAFAGYYATGHRLFDQGTALLPIETLRTLLGHDFFDAGSIDLVTDIAIRLVEGLGADEITAWKARLQRAIQPLLPAGSKACSVIDWQEQNSVFLRAIDQEHSMMQFVQWAPDAAAAVMDLIAKNMDWPGADQLAERLRKMLPRGIAEEAPAPQPPDPEAQAKAAEAQAKVAKAQAETEGKRLDNAQKELELASQLGAIEDVVREAVMATLMEILGGGLELDQTP